MNGPTPPSVDFDTLQWFKSHASSENGACVEAAFIGTHGIAIRDSKDPNGPVLTFDAATARAFLDAVKAGRFNLPT
jgi:hypothetical protein